MKQYNPLQVNPNTHQFYELVKDKLNNSAFDSAAYRATLSLFETAEKIYRSLNHLTSEQLSVFVDTGKYLTPTQEHDLMVITATAVTQIDTSIAIALIKIDTSLLPEERTCLLSAVECFTSTSQITAAALGNPRWIEP
jgi:hypothetical protein